MCVNVNRRLLVDCSSGSRVGNGQWVTSIEGWGLGACFGRMSTIGRIARSTFREQYHRRELPLGLHPFILGTLRGDHQPIRGHLITKLGHVLSRRLRGRHADFCLSFEASFSLPLFSLFFPQSAEAPDHSTTGPVLGSMNRASLVGHVLMSMASSQRKLILR